MDGEFGATEVMVLRFLCHGGFQRIFAMPTIPSVESYQGSPTRFLSFWCSFFSSICIMFNTVLFPFVSLLFFWEGVQHCKSLLLPCYSSGLD